MGCARQDVSYRGATSAGRSAVIGGGLVSPWRARWCPVQWGASRSRLRGCRRFAIGGGCAASAEKDRDRPWDESSGRRAVSGR